MSQEKKRSNIILVGMMGAGKSTVGRLLAHALGMGFIDTDSQIESRAGSSVAEIFAARGEENFRDLEKQVLQQFARAKTHVIAAGGGAVEAGEAWQLLAESGVVVWLNPSVDELGRRLFAAGVTDAATKNRPLLSQLGQDSKATAKERLGALLGNRVSFYRKADVMVEPAFETPVMTVQGIIAALRSSDFGYLVRSGS